LVIRGGSGKKVIRRVGALYAPQTAFIGGRSLLRSATTEVPHAKGTLLIFGKGPPLVGPIRNKELGDHPARGALTEEKARSFPFQRKNQKAIKQRGKGKGTLSISAPRSDRVILA